MVCASRMGDKGHKVKKQRFRLGIGRHFSTKKAVKQWIRLLREAVQSSALDIFKASLGKDLNNLV